MFNYLISLFNEIINYQEFSTYLVNNFNVTSTDSITLCYFVFLIFILIVLLIVTLGLSYFVRHTRNIWFGRRRY